MASCVCDCRECQKLSAGVPSTRVAATRDAPQDMLAALKAHLAASAP